MNTNRCDKVVFFLKRFVGVGFQQNLSDVCYSQSRFNFEELEDEDVLHAFECDVF